MEKLEKYSVLMSVYYKEQPDYLKESIESMLSQTVAPDQFVIVCDGELTRELDQVLLEYEYKNKNLFTILRRKENRGLGYSLNEGLEYCRNELIARMDSDDISLPQRCEKQLEIFSKNSNLSIIGTNVDEFENNIKNIVTSRIVPSTREDILKFSKTRSPFNHPSVMYKKSVVIRNGGYGEYYRKEDLYLFTKMVNEGEDCYNINESLLLYRISKDSLQRRKKWINCKEYILVIKNNYKKGYCTYFDFLYVVVGQLIFLLTPSILLKYISNRLLRKNIGEHNVESY